MKPRDRTPFWKFLLLGALVVSLPACAREGEMGDEGAAPAPQDAEPLTLGPTDGHDLPPTDLERVALGTVAPDFSLRTLDGDPLTLSSFRGQKNVILVFYRGHW